MLRQGRESNRGAHIILPWRASEGPGGWPEWPLESNHSQLVHIDRNKDDRRNTSVRRRRKLQIWTRQLAAASLSGPWCSIRVSRNLFHQLLDLKISSSYCVKWRFCCNLHIIPVQKIYCVCISEIVQKMAESSCPYPLICRFKSRLYTLIQWISTLQALHFLLFRLG